MNDLLTVEELATWLKVSERSIREMCRDRSRKNQKKPIPIVRIGRAVRFSRESITAWLHQLETETA